jgi:hypothetical protein
MSHLGGHFNFTAMIRTTFDFIVEKYKIQSMLDIGCGPAGMVEYANYKKIYSIGIDGDKDLPKKDYVLIHDFTEGIFNLSENFDLVYSTEFLEHVEEKYVSNFMPLFQKGKYIFVSAAPPGQGGHHHVNCQSKEYWIEKFSSYGLEYLKEESEKIRETSKDKVVCENSCFYLNKNFVKSSTFDKPFIIQEEMIKSNIEGYLKHGGVE